MKSNKAPDTDGLVSDFFLKISETICLPLSIIFRKSLDEGVVPKDLKLANVSAILKMVPRIMRIITDLSV